MRVDQDRELGLAQHVNEAGRDHHAVGVNGLLCAGMRKVTNGGDATVAHTHVALVPRRAGTVDDVAVTDDQIVGGSALGESRERRGEEEEAEEGEEARLGHERTGGQDGLEGGRSIVRNDAKILAYHIVAYYIVAHLTAAPWNLTLAPSFH